MIKINLATKKQTASFSAGAASSFDSSLSALSRISISSDGLKKLPVFTFILVAVIGYISSTFLESYKQDTLDNIEKEISAVQANQSKLQAELNKTKGYKEIKKQLDTDELSLRTKINTIQKLIDDRVVLNKLLLSLSQSLPKDVWLTDFRIKEADVTFKGASLGFIQISEFLKNLQENVYFRDVSLKGSQQSKDSKETIDGNPYTVFELEAKRR